MKAGAGRKALLQLLCILLNRDYMEFQPVSLKDLSCYLYLFWKSNFSASDVASKPNDDFANSWVVWSISRKSSQDGLKMQWRSTRSCVTGQQNICYRNEDALYETIEARHFHRIIKISQTGHTLGLLISLLCSSGASSVYLGGRWQDFAQPFLEKQEVWIYIKSYWTFQIQFNIERTSEFLENRFS